MRRTTMLWEAFVTRFEDALDRYKQGRLTAEKTGELLGMSGRHFRRLCGRFEADGIGRPADKRLGRRRRRRARQSELDRMRRLYLEECADFTGQASLRGAAQTAQLLRWATRYPTGVAVARPGEAMLRAAAGIARSGVRRRLRGCCCSRMARCIAGSARSTVISIWW